MKMFLLHGLLVAALVSPLTAQTVTQDSVRGKIALDSVIRISTSARVDRLAAEVQMILNRLVALLRPAAPPPAPPPPPPPATLLRLTIAPRPASLVAGTSQAFTVTATWSDGTTAVPPVFWSSHCGPITAIGTFTPVSGCSTGIVIVTSGAVADTVSMAITTGSVPPPGPPPPPPPPGTGSFFFNSSEAGCGTDPNILLCDDFEDGAWYEKNCDQANNTGGLLQVDGWCGNIFSGNPSTSGVCGGVGVKSACVATTGVMVGSGNMADHDLASPVNELWLRFYLKPLPGYVWGAEKVITINSNPAGFGGITIGGIGAPFSDGGMRACPVYDCNITGAVFYYSANMAPDLLLSAMAGRWVYIEIHLKLNTPGQKNGLYDLWMNDCGAAGVCAGTPTLRSRYTTVEWQAPTDNKQIKSIWFENWSNPASSGERYWDQIKVSKAGPIGFLP